MCVLKTTVQWHAGLAKEYYNNKLCEIKVFDNRVYTQGLTLHPAH